MITQSMRNDARFWVRETLERFGCESLDVKIQFNKRFTRRMGDAIYRFPGPRIRLSEPLWPLISQAERRVTVIHEACHILVMHEDDQAGRIGKECSKPHGIEWQSKMLACGVIPNRTASLDIDESLIVGSRRKYKLYCSCKVHHLTKQKYDKVVSGRSALVCRKCKERLSTDSTIAAARLVGETSKNATLSMTTLSMADKIVQLTEKIAPDIRKSIKGEKK